MKWDDLKAHCERVGLELETPHKVAAKENVTLKCPVHGPMVKRLDKVDVNTKCRKCAFAKEFLAKFPTATLTGDPPYKIKDYVTLNGKTMKAESWLRTLDDPSRHSTDDLVIDFIQSSDEHAPRHWHNRWREVTGSGKRYLAIHDFYWAIPHKRTIYESKIRHLKGLDTRTYARKCCIRLISIDEAKAFIESNHLEGYGFGYRNPTAYGLYHNDTLVMCCTVGDFYCQSTKTFKPKIHRIVSLLDHTIVGGLTKLIEHVKHLHGTITYQITLSTSGSSLRASRGHSLVSVRYWWVNPSTLRYYHRNATQKANLERTFDKPVGNMTEAEYMRALGYVRVYDCGVAQLDI